MKEKKLLIKSIRFFFIFAIIILFSFPLNATNTLIPQTDFEIDGNKAVDVLGLIDWDTPLPLAGNPPFAIAGSSDLTTGVFYKHMDPDLCDSSDDNGGLGGIKLQDGASWPETTAKAPAKDDLSAVWFATEKVYLNGGGTNDILYAAFERCEPQNGTMSAFIFFDNGDGLTPSGGGTDGDGDWLIVFDFDPSDGTMLVYLYMWGDTGGGVYDYVEITPLPAGAVDGKATVYTKVGGVGSGGDFGEVALNLTALGITDGSCDVEITVGNQTGTAAGITTPSQIKDLVTTHTLKICGLDFDDLPDSYDPITGNDPYACTTSNPESPFIGAGVTNESNGWDDPNADSDTDDGIGTWPLWEAGTCTGLLPDGTVGDITMDVDTYCFTVKATNFSATNAQLVGWIDWGDDGTFNEAIDRSALVLDGSTGNVPAGTDNQDVVLYWDGVTPQLGETYARLRITTDAEFKSVSSPTPHGATADGEIEGYLIPENSLPVELSSFTATAVTQGVELAWTTESEIENLGFILERRTEGTDWTEIASYKTEEGLLGQGSTTSATDYEYIDKLVENGTEYEYRLADVDYDGLVTYQASRQVTAGQTQQAVAVAEVFKVSPAYPNPFNPSTTISYFIPNNEGSVVQIKVYDILGNLVKTLFEQEQQSGNYSIVWDGKDNAGNIVPDGIYFSSIQYGKQYKTIKMMMLK